MNLESSHILIALTTYFVATASPGPAIIAIMNTAMRYGRKPALAFASGVLLGSLVWALLAIIGVAVLLSTHANLLYWLKIMGGLYLLWLAYRSARNVFATNFPSNKNDQPKIATSEKIAPIVAPIKNSKLFTQGLALHITNPKAIFTWTAIVSLALPETASTTLSLLVVAGCMMLGTLIFGGYALLFSTTKAQKAYLKFSHWFNAILSLVFGVAGLKLLSSQNQSIV